MTHTILIVDDQKSIREKLKLLINAEQGLKVVGMAENGKIAVEQAESIKPEIILLDLEMPLMGGIEASFMIARKSPKSKIIILTSLESKEYPAELDRSKIHGIYSKTDTTKLINSLQATKTNKLSKFKPPLNLNHRLLILLSPLLIILFLLTSIMSKPKLQSTQARADSQITPSQIFAPGTIIPEGNIIKLSVPNAEDSQIKQIFVEEGDLVEKGQLVAVLQGVEQQEQSLKEAENNLDFRKAELSQIIIGNQRESDLEIQKTEIEKKAATLRLAQQNYTSKKTLLKEGAISKAEVEEAEENLNLATANLKGEKRNLIRLSNLKPVEEKLARIEIDKAKIAIEQGKINLESYKVRAPVTGQILRINTRIGEKINTQQGIVELGRTNQMYAIAEIYESSINKIKIGQKATISSESQGFEGEVEGTVTNIGTKIGKHTLGNTLQDPTQDKNSQIIEVKIKIDEKDNKKISRLTHAKVLVAIDE